MGCARSNAPVAPALTLALFAFNRRLTSHAQALAMRLIPAVAGRDDSTEGAGGGGIRPHTIP